MPLFLIREQNVDQPRVIKAKSREAALSFAIAPRFTVNILSNPMEVADIVWSGVKVEDAEVSTAAQDQALKAAHDEAQANLNAVKGATVKVEG